MPLEVIDFFAVGLEDLAKISKYRIVHRPTFVLANRKNKALYRTFSIPDRDSIAVLKNVFGNSTSEYAAE